MKRTRFNHLTVNKELLRHSGPELSIYLSYLLDKYSYFKTKDQLKPGGWFFLPEETQLEELGITSTKLQNYRKILLTEDFLYSKTVKSINQEWNKLNLNKIFTGRYPSGSKDPSVHLQGQCLTNSTKNKKPSRKERVEEYLPIAVRLSLIIKTTKNITHTSKQIQTWAYSICQLVEDNHVDIPRIDKALTWYEKNVGGEWVPVIESGNSLKEKFYKLEAAMERSKTPVRDSRPKYKEWDGMKYYLSPDGRYRNKAGSLWID